MLTYCTIEETAKYLNTTPEGIYEKFKKTEGVEHLLFPTVLFRDPVLMRRRLQISEKKDRVKSKKENKCQSDAKYIEERVEGYFEIVGAYDVEWDNDGYLVLRSANQPYVLKRGDFSWFLVEEKRVHKSKLLVAQTELEDYMEIMGIEPPEELIRKSGKSGTDEISEYIRMSRTAGLSERTIANELHDKYRLINYQIAQALGLDRGLNPGQRSALKQRAQRLRDPKGRMKKST